MDPTWTFDLLSTRGLDQSILLTVLIGLGVMLFFSETLGWVFIGVVVPGYLASVMVIAPTSAAAILCEAIVTLVLARTLAVTLAKTGVWTQFFGRDRFFLIVLISVWVRQFNQSLVLPALEQFLRAHGYPSLTLTEDFSSIGLVLIPLTANMFWRLNLARGLLHFGTIVGLTYVLLKWVLLPYTNLTDASLVLLYEDSAIDFMSNAKSYIVLLVSAYLASVVNLKYGWDFGGILIAALLSLLWWTPIKLCLTLLEGVALYGATLLLLRLPFIRSLNLEGPRKIAVVFSYSFFLKCLIGLVIGDAFPGLKVTDLFAFGYLMSSILTVRIFVVGSVRRVILPVALTSALGFVLSSLASLWLHQFSQAYLPHPSSESPAQLVSTRSLRTPRGVLGYASARRSKTRSYSKASHFHPSANTPLWKSLAQAMRTRNFSLPSDWQARVHRSTYFGFELDTPSESRPVQLLHPGEDAEGNSYDGPLILLREHATGPSMVVQWAEQEPGLAQAAWLECLQSDCAAVLLFAKSALDHDKDLPATLRSEDLRLLSVLREVRPLWHIVFAPDLGVGEKDLHLDSSVSEAHAFMRDDLRYRWNPAPEITRLRAHNQDRVLRISGQERFQSIAEHWDLGLKTLPHPGLAAYLQSQRASVLPDIPDPSSTSHPFSATELRILEQRIVRPLLELNAQPDPDPHMLAALSFWASPLGIKIHWLGHCAEQGCFVLTLRDPQQALVWALAHQPSEQSDVEVPRPSREPGILGLGMALFDAHQLRSLLVHMGDWRYDPTHVGHTHSAYHAIHQGLDHHSDRDEASLSIILRGVRHEAQRGHTQKPLIRAGLGYPVLTTLERSEKLAHWSSNSGPLSFLGQLHWSDASPEHYRYSGAQIPQVRYSRLLGKKQPIVLWLPPETRNYYLHQSSVYWRDLAMRLDVPPEIDLDTDAPPKLRLIDERNFLQGINAPATRCATPPEQEQRASQMWSQILDRAEFFAKYRHPSDLHTLVSELGNRGESRVSIQRGAHSDTVYLAIEGQFQGYRFRALITLGQAHDGRLIVHDSGTLSSGPWPSLALAQLHRVRSLVSISCKEGG